MTRSTGSGAIWPQTAAPKSAATKSTSTKSTATNSAASETSRKSRQLQIEIDLGRVPIYLNFAMPILKAKHRYIQGPIARRQIT